MISRRTFLGTLGGCLTVPALAADRQRARGGRERLAVRPPEWRYHSHAWPMAERFLVGYPIRGKWHRPGLEVVSAYVDQFPANDLSRQRAAEFGFKIHPTVAEA